ncbi:L,D-transpeptidase family protein [Pseudogemmobacter faecipullorum]|uniref:L,D-transpeptidase family protein n=1 Tax=Pseudogemmobacter faecipullorum TaxID=2755041 RepID=UPI001D02F1D1
MHFSLSRLFAIAALAVLAACSSREKIEEAPAAVAGYEALVDGGYEIPAVEPQYLTEAHRKTEVDYPHADAPGTIVVDVFARKLYWVKPDGRATRYAIAVGREGTSFRGKGYIGRKAHWPSWTPTANMIRRQPEMYAAFAGGLPGGLDNPLSSRALYLYRGGRDTMFRIHGSIDNRAIGLATSAGCIRMFNQDVIGLYDEVANGTKVKVRTLEESLAAEGPYMDDAWGRAVPETPENIAKKAKDQERIAAAERDAAEKKLKDEEAARKAAVKAEAKRQRQCKRQGLNPEQCAAAEVVEVAKRS